MQSINYTCTSNTWGNDDYNQHIHSNLARHTHVLSTPWWYSFLFSKNISVRQSCHNCICTTCQKILRCLLKILAVTWTFIIWSSGNQEKFIQSLVHPRERIWFALWNFVVSSNISMLWISLFPKKNFLTECLLR